MFSFNLSRNYYNSTTLGKHIFNPKPAVKIRNTYRATLTAHILRQGSHLFAILQGMLTRLHVCKSEWSFQTAIRTCWHLRRWMGRLTFFFFFPPTVMLSTNLFEIFSQMVALQMDTEVIRVLLRRALAALHLQGHAPYAVSGAATLLPRACNYPLFSPFSSGIYAVLNLDFQIKMMQIITP